MSVLHYSKKLPLKNAFIILFIMLCFLLQTPITFMAATTVLFVYAIKGNRGAISTSSALFLLVFPLISLPAFLSFTHATSPFFCMLVLVVFFAAKKMARNPAHSLLISYQASFYVYVIAVLLLYYIHREANELFGEILEGVSTNGIPSYLIVLQVVYSLVAYTVTGRLPLFSTLCTLVVAILGVGRGSIFAGCMIVAFSVFFNILLAIKHHRHGVVALYALGMVVLGLVSLLYFDAIHHFLNNSTKALHGFSDPARAVMFSQYLDKITPVSFFTGAGYEGTNIELFFKNNPHISFIRTHAYLGIGGLLLVFISPFFLFMMQGKRMRKLIFFTFLLVLFLRAASEPILFPTLLDFFFCFIFWFYYFHARNENNVNANPQTLIRSRVS